LDGIPGSGGRHPPESVDDISGIGISAFNFGDLSGKYILITSIEFEKIKSIFNYSLFLFLISIPSCLGCIVLSELDRWFVEII